MMALPPYVPQEDLAAISEEAANRAFEGMQYAQLRDLPEAVARGPVDVAYLATAPPPAGRRPPKRCWCLRRATHSRRRPTLPRSTSSRRSTGCSAP